MRRMRTFARTAAKSMEKKLVDNAKQLQKDPYLILPEYSDNYSRKHFEKVKKSLSKVHQFNDDAQKLEKFAKKKGLDGALAGTLSIAHSEKAPYLAVAKFSTGDVTYAQRGKADKEKLIAVQHFDDPVLRLLGIKDISLKKKLHVYSWDEGFVSTGLEANPPKEFVDFIMDKIDFSYSNGVAVCNHLKREQAKNRDILKKYYLHINWKSADSIIAICEDCTKSTKNTMFEISKYLIIPDIPSDFSIEIVGHVVKKDSELGQQTLHIDDYLSGSLTDFEFIKKNIEYREKSLKESGEKIFILNGNSYGTNANDFIDALKPKLFERTGLELILEQIDEPVVLDNVTANKVLEKFWKDYGLDAISSIIDDELMAKKFFDLDETPSNILEVVFNYKERQQILSRLPQYDSLPPLAKFVDNIARTYKTFGEKEALAVIKKRLDTSKAKSISYAFLLVFGKAKEKKWQYSAVEIEYGEFLKEYAKKLLDSEPKNYHKRFQELLTSSGSSENIDSHKL